VNLRTGRNAPRFAALTLAAAMLTVLGGSGRADPLRIQGSSTFNRQLMEEHRGKIELKSGQMLKVVPNRTALGLQALAEGRADIAMISAPLANELANLQSLPNVASLDFQVHPITATRVAIGIHQSNKVRSATLDQLTKILRGKLTNWSDLGGADAPIRIVVVGEGGGVTTTLESALLKGEPITASNVLYVRTAVQLAWVVEQDPNTLAFGQLSLLKQRGIPEIKTEQPIEQPLSLVTLGPPTDAMMAVIRATRDLAGSEM
jgi:phosphate transport system substrate-binding protein